MRVKRSDEDLDREIRSHIEAETRDNIERGMSAQAAESAARRSFGSVALIGEDARAVWTLRWVEQFFQDSRYGWRLLRRTPTLTAAAVLTLALGIGANTAMFSIADATAFRPPDVPRPGELVRVFANTKDTSDGRLSFPDYVDYRDRMTTLSGVVAYRYAPVALSRKRGDIPSFVGAWVVSGNFFSVLEVELPLGRDFREEEHHPGASPVAIISHALWERDFGSDSSVIGAPVILGTHEFTIVGVAPAAFTGTELYLHPDVYVPIAQSHQIDSTLPDSVLEDRSRRALNVLGRRRAGIGVETASAEASTLAKALEEAHPETNRGLTAVALPEIRARAILDHGGYQSAVIMMAIVGLVLLMACANVANLLIARAAGRTREIVVRLALGVSRGRLIRQLLTESLVLASAGGLLGIAVAFGGIRYVSAMFAANFATSDLPVVVDARVDARLLLFTLSASLTTGLLSGLARAWLSFHVDLVSSLKSSVGARRPRTWMTIRTVLVASELALAMLVLTTTGLSIRGFVEQRRADPGFRTDHVLLMSFNPSLVNYSRDQITAFYRQIVERTKTVPGVEAAGLVQFIPLGVNGPASTLLVIEGYETPDGRDRVSLTSNVVDAGYWTVVRTPIVRGRPFDDDRDTSSSPGVIIVNETMAKRFWPTEDSLGKTVRLGDRNGPVMEIVGIAKDGKYGTLGEPQRPSVFLPSSQRFRPLMTLVVRAKGDAASLATPIRAQARALGGDVPVFDVRTFDNLYQNRALMSARLTAQMLAALGGLALVLAVGGVYGILAFLTARRTREIGLRMAVGADRARVLLLIVRQALPMVGSGIVAGILLAFFLTPALAAPFDLVSRDARILATVLLVLTAAALAASLIPAWRAAAMEPTVALREE